MASPGTPISWHGHNPGAIHPSDEWGRLNNHHEFFQGTENRRAVEGPSTCATFVDTPPSTSTFSRTTSELIQVLPRRGSTWPHLTQAGRFERRLTLILSFWSFSRGKAIQVRFLWLPSYATVQFEEAHGPPHYAGRSAIRGHSQPGGSRLPFVSSTRMSRFHSKRNFDRSAPSFVGFGCQSTFGVFSIRGKPLSPSFCRFSEAVRLLSTAEVSCWAINKVARLSLAIRKLGARMKLAEDSERAQQFVGQQQNGHNLNRQGYTDPKPKLRRQQSPFTAELRQTASNNLSWQINI